MRRLIQITFCCFLLASCSDRTDDEAMPEERSSTVSEKPVNNPLAKQQAFIKEAEAVQGLFDKDGERKKKALDELN